MFTPPLAFGHGIIIVSWICLQHMITRSQPTGCPYIMVGDWGRNCKGKQCLTEQWTRSSTPQYACHLFRPPMNLLTHPTQPFSTEPSLRARKGWTKLIQDSIASKMVPKHLIQLLWRLWLFYVQQLSACHRIDCSQQLSSTYCTGNW